MNNEAKVDVTATSVAPGESSPSIGNNENTSRESVNSSQSTQEKPETIGFGDKRHPEYKRFKELTESNKASKKELETLRRELSELKGFKESMLSQNKSNQPPVDAQLKAQIKELFGVALSEGEIKSMIAQAFGLDKLEGLTKDVSSLKESWESNQAQAEMDDVLKSAKDLGLDGDEVQSELEAYVEENPFFASKEYQKGAIWAAFKDKYWDRVGELRTKQENKKRIEERDRLRSGQTQTSAPGNAGEGKLPEKGGDRFAELVKRAGGMKNVNWAK